MSRGVAQPQHRRCVPHRQDSCALARLQRRIEGWTREKVVQYALMAVFGPYYEGR